MYVRMRGNCNSAGLGQKKEGGVSTHAHDRSTSAVVCIRKKAKESEAGVGIYSV